MAEDVTLEKAEKLLGMKKGEIAAHRKELQAMKDEMIGFVLSYTCPPLESGEIEITDADHDEAEQIVLGLLSIGTKYGLRKVFYV